MNNRDIYEQLCARTSRYTTRSFSTSFSWGIAALDQRFHAPIHGIYGFVRIADEIVDTFHGHDKSDLLRRFREDTYRAITEGISLNPILHSFQRVVNTYHVERELYDTHVDRVYRLAYRMTGDSTQAEEYTQETFIKVYDRLGTFRGEAALSTWITSVAVSVVLNGMRTAKRRREREHYLEQADRVTTSERRSDPDLKARLKAAIDRLPESLRTVFLMHDVEGFTHQEIADSMGLAEGTSKANLSRARAQLRVALADFAGAWE